MKRMNWNVFLSSGVVYNGKMISVTGDVYVAENCKVNADIETEGDVYLDDNVSATNVRARGNVYVGKKVQLRTIIAGGKVFIEDDTIVWCVVTKNEAYLGNNVDISDIEATDVFAGSKVQMESVTARGDVELGDHSSIFEVNIGGFLYRDGEGISITYIDAIKNEETEAQDEE